MSDTMDLFRMANWRGKTLVSAEGRIVGKIEEVLLDDRTGQPVWLAVGKSVVTLLVPAAGAEDSGVYVRCGFTREKIENQPPTNLGQGFANLGEERQLYEYFGLAMDREPALRVLPRDLPGLPR